MSAVFLNFPSLYFSRNLGFCSNITQTLTLSPDIIVLRELRFVFILFASLVGSLASQPGIGTLTVCGSKSLEY